MNRLTEIRNLYRATSEIGPCPHCDGQGVIADQAWTDWWERHPPGTALYHASWHINGDWRDCLYSKDAPDDPSPYGPEKVACPHCLGTGDRRISAQERIRAEAETIIRDLLGEVDRLQCVPWLDEALNSGDGVYRP